LYPACPSCLALGSFIPLRRAPNVDRQGKYGVKEVVTVSRRRFTFRTAIVLAFLCVVTFFPAALMPTAAAQEIHLEVWHAWTGFREPLVDKMLQDFMAEHPHIKVTHRIASDLHEEFTLAYAGGVAPDIIMVTTKHLVALADQGVFVELDPWLERDGISRDIWIPGEITSGEWQGKIYGLGSGGRGVGR